MQFINFVAATYSKLMQDIQLHEYLQSDEEFDQLFPASMRRFSQRHWTPLRVIKLAGEYLGNEPGKKILDIGSGIGKFCLAAAGYAPSCYFYGIEQRPYMVEYAENARYNLGISNVSFLQGNFTELDFNDFDHFYFFNSFYEHLVEEGRIDREIRYSKELYDEYVVKLRDRLNTMPLGTRIATYHSSHEEIPLGYHLVDTLEGGNLNFWMKREE